MADEKKKPEKPTKKNGRDVTLSGTELIILLAFLPLVLTWLALGARIIYSATSNPEVLDSIEGLLTAISIMTIPVSLGFNEIFKRYSTEQQNKDKENEAKD
jgi:hypothetical protein